MAQDVQEAVDRMIQEEKENEGREEEEDTNWVNYSDLESEDSSD